MNDHHEYIDKKRSEFLKGSLNEMDIEADPFVQFETWLKQALDAEVPELQAMQLCTVYDNKPSSRIVYLRKMANNKFWFYGNYNSKKGKSIEQNPNACLNFFWPELQRQVRIEGTVKKATPDNSDNYFNSRPRESQIGAWASAQSNLISTRDELEKKLQEITEKFECQPVLRPDFWGGWVFKASYYEFWQGRKSRLHDRICYDFKNDVWDRYRLAP
ncbi:MAG: pyridoxamine 5'-phosphate oxidase [Bacteroidetes bacterium]|nr:pyridoxamine 5'-phosphate oxidase [Bacteroidota bacterium]